MNATLEALQHGEISAAGVLKLNDRLRFVLSCRAGYFKPAQTLGDIGCWLNITTERVRQLENKAIIKAGGRSYGERKITRLQQGL